MKNKAHTSAKSAEFVSTSDLPRLTANWLMDGEISYLAERTLSDRRDLLVKFHWLLTKREIEVCDVNSLRQFLLYVANGHKEPGGRWGNPRKTGPTKPGTAKDYFAILRTFFRWLVEEGEVEASPMARIPMPVDRPDQIQPFTDDQVRALLASAKKSNHSRRDEAILLLLLDTGIRVSELCALRNRDIDLDHYSCKVENGKGGKMRQLPFSREVKRALYQYMDERKYEEDGALFTSDRGHTTGEALTRSGIAQLIRRLGKGARISGVRLSAHTFRHTFAISFLRAGGNTFALQQMLGHTDLGMTQRYVAVAQADIANQHRQFSPVARLKGRR